MIDLNKLVVAGICLLAIAILVSASIYISSLNTVSLDPIISRRDDLMAQQQKLEAVIVSLNSTLKREQLLNQELGQVFKSMNSTQSTPVTQNPTPAPTISPPVVTTPPPQPVQQPQISLPRTRAS